MLSSASKGGVVLFFGELVSSSEMLKTACKEMIEKHLYEDFIYLPIDIDSKIDLYTFKENIIKNKNYDAIESFLATLLNLNKLTFEEVNSITNKKDTGVIFEAGPIFSAVEFLGLLYRLWKNEEAPKEKLFSVLVDKFKMLIHDVSSLWSPKGIDCFIYIPTLYKQHTKDNLSDFLYFIITTLLQEDIVLSAVPFRFFEEELKCPFLGNCVNFALNNFYLLYELAFVSRGMKGELLNFLKQAVR